MSLYTCCVFTYNFAPILFKAEYDHSLCCSLYLLDEIALPFSSFSPEKRLLCLEENDLLQGDAQYAEE